MADDVHLAHSPRHGVSAQTYCEHISNVRHGAVRNARSTADFYTGDRETFLSWVEAAAVYHDLGKLDRENQAILQEGSQKPLPIAHDDAGVAALWELRQKESAVLVAAHHAGLFSKSGESPPNKKRLFRDERRPPSLGERRLDKYVDANLREYLNAHEDADLPIVTLKGKGQLHRCGFTRRIALSCLWMPITGIQLAITVTKSRFQKSNFDGKSVSRHCDGTSGVCRRETASLRGMNGCASSYLMPAVTRLLIHRFEPAMLLSAAVKQRQ